MITFSNLGIQGRLGNQMFQYALVKSMAIRNGDTLVVPDRKCQLYDTFQIPDQRGSVSGKRSLYQENGMPFSSFYNDMAASINKTKLVVDFAGYFQTEKYFTDTSDSIRSILSFRPDLVTKADKCVSSIGSKVCAVHVRRTDYLQTNDHLPVQPMEYYQQAMRLFPGYKFLVISDDIEWCAKNFLKFNAHLSVGGGYASDMCLISRCHAAIIANSSFSWWGAWLGNTGNVVAPKMWFGPPSKLDARDIVPDRWKKI